MIDLSVQECEVLLLAKSCGSTKNLSYVQDYVVRYGKMEITKRGKMKISTTKNKNAQTLLFDQLLTCFYLGNMNSSIVTCSLFSLASLETYLRKINLQIIFLRN